MGNKQLYLKRVTNSVKSSIKPRIYNRGSISKPDFSSTDPRGAVTASSTFNARTSHYLSTEDSSPESIMTDYERESSNDSIKLETLLLDEAQDQIEQIRGSINFNQLPEDHNTHRTFRPIRNSESGWNGFGIDASFVETSQHFATRRRREELLYA